jgi:hypothetical protein
VIDGPESADAVAAEIMKTPVRRGWSTSISGAINFAVQLFEDSPYGGLQRVNDIFGDGPNNDGAPVTRARRRSGEGRIVMIAANAHAPALALSGRADELTE